MELASQIAFSGAILAVVGYIIVRVWTFAYFRSKIEYLRSRLRELKGEHENGG